MGGPEGPVHRSGHRESVPVTELLARNHRLPEAAQGHMWRGRTRRAAVLTGGTALVGAILAGAVALTPSGPDDRQPPAAATDGGQTATPTPSGLPTPPPPRHPVVDAPRPEAVLPAEQASPTERAPAQTGTSESPRRDVTGRPQQNVQDESTARAATPTPTPTSEAPPPGDDLRGPIERLLHPVGG